MTDETRIPAGLSDEEVALRILENRTNIQKPAGEYSVRKILFSNIFTYFNLIFLLIAAALLAVRSYNHLMFLPIIVANTVIGIVQELRAKRTLDRLSLMCEAGATVRRGGAEKQVPNEELVLDDIVLLQAGAQIPADAGVLCGEVSVNESLLTGEADEVIKTPGDMLLSGSFVISGRCYARLARVGADCYAARVTAAAREQKRPQPVGMMRSLTLLIRIIGILMVPIGALLFWRQIASAGLSIEAGVESTAAALLGMIPDGLFLLVSIALAVSVIRLSKKQVLVRKLSCIEALARVDVLCVDKTGTITEDEMRVEQIIPVHGEAQRAATEALLADFTAAMSCDNNTITALKKYFEAPSYRPFSLVIPFSSATKYSGVTFDDGESYVLGAPDVLLRGTRPELLQAAEGYSRGGCRVLLLGAYNARLQHGPLTMAAEPLALVCLSNRIRENARETFSYFAAQGVEVRVISGDSPVTVSAVAAAAGIANAENYVDARTLDTPEKLQAAAGKFSVFGRVTPEQKRALILAMKAAGHTVAMTGDGVNDVMAMKVADCSIAMASGSDAAGRVADLVLLHSNFSAMPAVVGEGRRVINNIERSAALFLVKNIFSFFLSLITIIAAFAYPLTPAQLTLFNTLMIGLPSFVLALEPNRDRIKGKFLRNVLRRAFPPALTNLFLVLTAVLFTAAFPALSYETSTVAVILMGCVGTALLCRICKPFNLMRRILVSVCVVGFLLGLLFLPGLFSMARLDFPGLVVLFVTALLTVPVLHAADRLLSFATSLWARLRSIRPLSE